MKAILDFLLHPSTLLILLHLLLVIGFSLRVIMQRPATGVALAWLDDHLSGDVRRTKKIEEFTSLGLMESTDTHLRLTGRGLFVADAILSELL